MSAFVNSLISFPAALPKGYAYLDEPVAFDPAVHLALEFPKERLSIRGLGYGADVIAGCPTDFAVASGVRHKAWLAQGKLGQLIEGRGVLVAALRGAVADVEVAIADLEDESDPSMIHYGD